MAQPSPPLPSQREAEAEAEAPSSPPNTSAQPLAPQSPYVVISSSSSRDRPSRRLRIPSDYSADGFTAEAVIAATGEGAPLLASRRDLANRDESGGGGGVRGSIYALTADGDGTDAQQPLPGTGIIRRPRPRFWYLLPLLSLLDILLESAVSFPLLFPTSTTAIKPKPNPGNPSGSIDPTRTRTLTATLLSACLLRCATLSIISIGNRTDQLGLIVAGVCAASALVGVSVFNLLFQEGALSPSPTSTFTPSSWTSNLPPPSLTLLTSLGLGFTVLEYILYVIVVGIRVPPSQGQAGGVRRMGDVRRWKRGVRAAAANANAREGQGSDWSVYMDEEEEEEEEEEEGGAGEDVEPTRKRRRASYVDPATALTPGNSGNLEVAGSSGSKSSSLLLLPEAAITPPPASASYGALEASRPLSSLLPQSAFSAASTAAEGSVRGDQRRRTTSTTSTRSRSGALDAALPTSSSTSPAGSTGRLRLSASPSRSPGTNPHVDLEAAAPPSRSEDEGGEEDDGEEEEDADPNEILDIPSFPSSTSRDASRMRLAMASEPASSRGRRLSAIRGGDDGEESQEGGAGAERGEEGAEEQVVAVPQRRRGWRTGGGGAGASTSLLPFKRKKAQRGESGTSAAAGTATEEANAQSSLSGGGGGWRAGGRRLLRSALPGGGNTASGSGSRS